MTRKIARNRNFDIVLDIKSDEFIRPPRESQRNWLLSRAVREFTDDLSALDVMASRFVAGSDVTIDPSEDRTNKPLDDDAIMEDWQIPIMERMAQEITVSRGDILEIGFGRGVASDFIQKAGVRTHTVVECNDYIVRAFEEWRKGYPESDIRLLHGKWQDLVDSFDEYDGIFFHAYPLNTDEHLEYVVKSPTFAAHFFETAARHLRKDGAFTYLTNEYDSLSRSHQRLLLRHFSSFTVSRLVSLALPDNSRDFLWGDSIVIVRAVL